MPEKAQADFLFARIDFPDLRYAPGFDVIAGLLLVPLSVGGSDFIGKYTERPRYFMRTAKQWVLLSTSSFRACLKCETCLFEFRFARLNSFSD